MDECMLNDLLECSVCLERLDTSSKVLPCQHTFCKRCLEEIVTTHKELRCPECRVLVDIKIDDLPPNVLLMRILEGMKNAPKKHLLEQQQQQQPQYMRGNLVRSSTVHTTSLVQTQQQQPSPQLIVASTVNERNQGVNKGLNALAAAHQPYGIALCNHTPTKPDELGFKEGDVVLLRKRMGVHGLYLGESSGKQGVFPACFIQIMIPLPSIIPQCKALYDFRMTGEDEEGCLAFSKGAIINVIRRVDENWAEGRLNERVGIFPLAFVELNGLARSLMKLSSNSQPGPSRVTPPTPTTEESSPIITTDFANITSSNLVARNQQSNTQSNIHPLPRQASDSSSTVSSTSPSTTPNTSSSNTSSSSSTAPSSPTSPPPPRPTVSSTNTVVHSPPPRSTTASNLLTQSVNQREKRHSFSAINSGHHHHSNHRHSAEILSSDEPPAVAERHRRSNEAPTVPPPLPPTQNGSHSISSTTNLPAAYIALYPYAPQKPDELELRKGGIYMVTERCQDGWFKGTSNRTQKCGVFPGNYVASARGVPRGTTALSGIGSPRNSIAPPLEPRNSVTYTRTGKSGTNVLPAPNVSRNSNSSKQPPELPPRSVSPAGPPTSTVSCSWHGQPETATSSSIPLNRSQSAVMSPSVSSSAATSTPGKSAEKPKERKDKGTVSLMRRLTSMKRSKSPPPLTYSMDNPMFIDCPNDASPGKLAGPSPPHPVHVSSETSDKPTESMMFGKEMSQVGNVNSTPTVHVRSGSCPSQLLQTLPHIADVNNSVTQNAASSHHRFALASSSSMSGSQRSKHKERGHIMQLTSMHSSSTRHGEPSKSSVSSNNSSNHHHRKSNSLDAGSQLSSSKPIQSSTPRERFRCIVPYPPNSEYELELRLNDIIYVHKKRDDGWYKGTQQRTGRTGLFPASFVESF